MSDLCAYKIATDVIRMGDEVPIVILASDDEGGITVTIAQGNQKIVLGADRIPDLYIQAMQAAEFAGHRSDA